MGLSWLCGGALIAIALLPQLIKTWKTKSTKDISYLWTLMLLAGLLLYILFAIKNSIGPLMVFASVEAVMTITLICFKIKYDKIRK